MRKLTFAIALILLAFLFFSSFHLAAIISWIDPLNAQILFVFNFYADSLKHGSFFEATSVFRSSDIVSSVAKLAQILGAVCAFFVVLLILSSAFSQVKRAGDVPKVVFGLIFPFMRFFRRSEEEARPWGLVYDSVTKLPIDPALVTIATYESGVGEFKQTRITDIDGRFGFLVTPGRYVIVSEKTHYLFPSKKVKGLFDGKFENVYHGEVFEVEDPYITNLNIPMDPVSYDWNQENKPGAKKGLAGVLKQRVRVIILIIGIFCALGVYILFPTGQNLLLLIIFGASLLFWESYFPNKLWGTIFDKASGKPIGNVNINAIRMPQNISLGHTTSDHLGRYFLLMSAGNYTVQVETSGKTPKILAKFENVKVTKRRAVVNFDIGV
ncbi:MAG: hypothetical protein NUV69_05785 [Candidatus Curtissbacteria bacterium]|nr:hypothetical protein [Candidatus Curtissbacteria bacterium]